MELVDLAPAARLLLQQDWVLILCHQSPDGDTIGSGYALCHALHQLGRHAAVLCSDPVPRRMAFVTEGLSPALSLTPEEARFVVSVDIADVNLMGGKLLPYQSDGAVDLAIDHHPTHRPYAKRLLLRGDAAANCQTMFDLLEEMGVKLTFEISRCL